MHDFETSIRELDEAAQIAASLGVTLEELQDITNKLWGQIAPLIEEACGAKGARAGVAVLGYIYLHLCTIQHIPGRRTPMYIAQNLLPELAKLKHYFPE